MPYPVRTGLSLYHCFQKTISAPIIKFISVEKSNPIASGEDLKVLKRHLHDIYKAKYSSEFLSFILDMSLPRTTQSFSHYSQWR